jgi:hypothetical protein
MNYLERLTYFEQLWEKFLPDIPKPKPADIDWGDAPTKVVEQALFATSKRFYSGQLEFNSRRHAFNYVCKVVSNKWTEALNKERAAQRAIDRACSVDVEADYQEPETK